MASALLGMPDTAALKLININVDSIQVEVAECKTNTCDMRESNIKQEMHVVEKGCTNTDADSKIKAPMVKVAKIMQTK